MSFLEDRCVTGKGYLVKMGTQARERRCSGRITIVSTQQPIVSSLLLCVSGYYLGMGALLEVAFLMLSLVGLFGGPLLHLWDSIMLDLKYGKSKLTRMQPRLPGSALQRGMFWLMAGIWIMNFQSLISRILAPLTTP